MQDFSTVFKHLQPQHCVLCLLQGAFWSFLNVLPRYFCSWTSLSLPAISAHATPALLSYRIIICSILLCFFGQSLFEHWLRTELLRARSPQSNPGTSWFYYAQIRACYAVGGLAHTSPTPCSSRALPAPGRKAARSSQPLETPLKWPG